MGRKRKTAGDAAVEPVAPSASQPPTIDPTWQPSPEDEFQQLSRDAARCRITVDFAVVERAGHVSLDLDARLWILTLLITTVEAAEDQAAIEANYMAIKKVAKAVIDAANVLSERLNEMQRWPATTGPPIPIGATLSEQQIARALSELPTTIEQAMLVYPKGNRKNVYRRLAEIYSLAGGTPSASNAEPPFIRFVRAVLGALPDSAVKKRS